MKQLLFFLFATPMLCFGQVDDEPLIFKYDLPGSWENDREFVVKGTVYLDKQFRPGNIIKYGKDKDPCMLRYDVYRDQFEILRDEKTKVFLIRNKEIELELDNKHYQYIDYLDHDNPKLGYFERLHQGITLLYLRTVKTIGFRLPENGYDSGKPPILETRQTYYLKRKNRPALRLNDLSRKEVFAVLWDKYSELRSYARKNKLSMRTEAEVIAVLAHYDSLKLKEAEDREETDG